jgi:hypothetical protein
MSDYLSLKKHTIKLGVHDEVRSYAKKLQIQLGEPDTNVPFKDAYEMAYNEIVIPKYT